MSTAQNHKSFIRGMHKAARKNMPMKDSDMMMEGKERKPKPQGKGIIKALGQKGTTGNFKRIAKAKGKGAAIAALQNKLAKRRGKPIPYPGKGRK